MKKWFAFLVLAMLGLSLAVPAHALEKSIGIATFTINSKPLSVDFSAGDITLTVYPSPDNVCGAEKGNDFKVLLNVLGKDTSGYVSYGYISCTENDILGQLCVDDNEKATGTLPNCITVSKISPDDLGDAPESKDETRLDYHLDLLEFSISSSGVSFSGGRFFEVQREQDIDACPGTSSYKQFVRKLIEADSNMVLVESKGCGVEYALQVCVSFKVEATKFKPDICTTASRIPEVVDEEISEEDMQ